MAQNQIRTATTREVIGKKRDTRSSIDTYTIGGKQEKKEKKDNTICITFRCALDDFPDEVYTNDRKHVGDLFEKLIKYILKNKGLQEQEADEFFKNLDDNKSGNVAK